MSGDQLFDDADLFTGDPLDPDFEQVCPPTVIAGLTRSQREQRVLKLVNQAHGGWACMRWDDLTDAITSRRAARALWREADQILQESAR